MHRPNHTQNRHTENRPTGNRKRRHTWTILLALLAAGCAPSQRLDPPGLLGALFDRPPPAVSVSGNGGYPNPLAEPVYPILSQDVADVIVAEPLRRKLRPAARTSLAAASERAAAAPTGSTVLWESAGSGGAVVPMRDPYRSHRGAICRDLQQQAQGAAGASYEQVTLCRTDSGDGHINWLPGSAD